MYTRSRLVSLFGSEHTVAAGGAGSRRERPENVYNRHRHPERIFRNLRLRRSGSAAFCELHRAEEISEIGRERTREALRH